MYVYQHGNSFFCGKKSDDGQPTTTKRIQNNKTCGEPLRASNQKKKKIQPPKKRVEDLSTSISRYYDLPVDGYRYLDTEIAYLS